MKTQLLLGVVLCAAAQGVGAQTPQNDESVTVKAPPLQIVVPEHTFNMDRLDFEKFRGGYELSNGQTLFLLHDGFAMYAELGHLGRHRIVASGPSAFVALDRKLQVKIALLPNGQVGGEVLIAMPARVAAAGQPQENVIRLALQ